jgi:hypothetical protein
VKHLLLAAVAALALSASLASCSDMFNPPELPDLHKDPYDFSVIVPPFNGDGGGGSKDLAGEGTHDLSMGSTTD